MRGFKPRSGLFARVMAVLLLFGITGGHWTILQSIAWTRMIVVYSRNASFQTALEQTFDGKHPCGMCKMIEKAKQSTNQQELKRPSLKNEPSLSEPIASILPYPPWRRGWFGLAHFIYPSRTDTPPLPPPKGGSAFGVG